MSTFIIFYIGFDLSGNLRNQHLCCRPLHFQQRPPGCPETASFGATQLVSNGMVRELDLKVGIKHELTAQLVKYTPISCVLEARS